MKNTIIFVKLISRTNKHIDKTPVYGPRNSLPWITTTMNKMSDILPPVPIPTLHQEGFPEKVCLSHQVLVFKGEAFLWLVPSVLSLPLPCFFNSLNCLCDIIIRFIWFWNTDSLDNKVKCYMRSISLSIIKS